MAANVARLRTDMNQARRVVEGATAKMTKAAATARTALVSIGGGLAGIQVARSITQASDAITVLSNKLKLASRDANEASKAYDGLFQIAQKSRVSFTELGSTYAAIARNTKQLGVSQSELLTVTESIANAMTVSGGSAESMKAALVQLGQGMASGTLRGEELNSVMEQTPRLAQALADGMGITIGQLREMGQAGLITSKTVVEALKSQSEILKNEVGGSAVTVSQSMTVLSNATQDFVGTLNQVTGASTGVTSAIMGIADAVKALTGFIKDN
jgi:tape measure domain-containing protein